jgi:hypothetical protein
LERGVHVSIGFHSIDDFIVIVMIIVMIHRKQNKKKKNHGTRSSHKFSIFSDSLTYFSLALLRSGELKGISMGSTNGVPSETCALARQLPCGLRGANNIAPPFLPFLLFPPLYKYDSASAVVFLKLSPPPPSTLLSSSLSPPPIKSITNLIYPLL